MIAYSSIFVNLFLLCHYFRISHTEVNSDTLMMNEDVFYYKIPQCKEKCLGVGIAPCVSLPDLLPRAESRHGCPCLRSLLLFFCLDLPRLSGVVCTPLCFLDSIKAGQVHGVSSPCGHQSPLHRESEPGRILFTKQQ
jgi:hypothetical protein